MGVQLRIDLDPLKKTAFFLLLKLLARSLKTSMLTYFCSGSEF